MLNIQEVLRLLKCFPNSFVNTNGDFIVSLKTQSYFILNNCSSLLELQCKVLNYLSRDATKAIPYSRKSNNIQYRSSILKGINTFLGTSFTTEEMMKIYTKLGGGIKEDLTKRFIESNYDLSLLE